MATLPTPVDMFPSCTVESAIHRQQERKIYSILPHLFDNVLAGNSKSALKKKAGLI